MRLLMLLGLCLAIACAVMAEPVYTLVAVGDLNFDDGLGRMILEKGPDYPWRDTINLLTGCDLLMGNLEVPLSSRGAVWIKKKYLLRADPRTVDALTAAGFDLVSLANNHMMDFGAPALLDTLALLDERGIAHAGAGPNEQAARAPALANLGPLRLACLSYCRVYPSAFRAGADRPGTAWCPDAAIVTDVIAARKSADLVIVAVHWGADYVPAITASQRTLAHACVDNGAAAVLGHHPHILQGFEVYKQGFIAYSLGNFAFGSLNKKAVDGAILRLQVDPSGGLRRVEIYPVNVSNYAVNFQTRLRHGADAARVIGDLRRLSAPLGTEIVNEDGVGVILLGGR